MTDRDFEGQRPSDVEAMAAGQDALKRKEEGGTANAGLAPLAAPATLAPIGGGPYTPAAKTREELILALRAGTPWQGDLNMAADLLSQDAARMELEYPLPLEYVRKDAVGIIRRAQVFPLERHTAAALMEYIRELELRMVKAPSPQSVAPSLRSEGDDRGD